MAYGTIKVDQITFTNSGVDQTITVSGIVESISGNITATGTIQAQTIIGTSTVSGATVTGVVGQFTTATITSGVFASGTAASPSVSVGTTSNGIYSPGTNQLALSTNGTGRLFVDASGRLLAGTSTAGATNADDLTINATGDCGITIRAGNTSSSSILFADGTTGDENYRGYVEYDHNGDFLRLATAASERLRITSAGLVGIGTSSPTALLTVNGVGAFGAGSAAAPSIAFSADLNTGIYSPGADQVALSTGGTGRLFVDASGWVGVGTNQPLEVLHVKAGDSGVLSALGGIDGAIIEGAAGRTTGLLFHTPNDRRAGLFFSDPDNAAIGSLQYDHSSDSLFAVTNNTERLRITSAGLVGIGTSSPTALLTVNGVGAFGAGSAAAPSIAFSADLNTGIYSPGADQLALSTNGTGRLRVTSGGQVLLESSNSFIGVNTEDGSDTSTLLVGGGGAASNSRGAYVWMKGNENTDAGALVLSAGNVGTAPITAVTAGNERLRITSAGLVGIGTSNPSQLLDVRGSSNPQLKISETNNGTSPGIYIENQGQRNWQIWANRATDALSFGANERANTFVAINGATGNVGIGTASPSYLLDLNANSANVFRIASPSEAGSPLILTVNSNVAPPGGNQFFVSHSGATVNVGNARSHLAFFASNTERARIDSSGRLLVGTSSARESGSLIETELSGTSYKSFVSTVNSNSGSTYAPHYFFNRSRGTANGSATLVSNGDRLGVLLFRGADGSTFVTSAQIEAEVDGTPGANDMPGRLVFSTTPDGSATPVERMRILSGGGICLNTTALIDPATGSNDGFSVNTDGFTGISGNGFSPLNIRRRTSDGAIVGFRRDTTLVGTISVTTTATAYNTSSDYRLKENVTPVTDGITRLEQLKPSRFNFIADPTKTVDGFLAHEVQAIVPEAITGEKDAVDEDGNPVYQGIDQSKLVPLLTAALQEAIGEIESLKARVAALESV